MEVIATGRMVKLSDKVQGQVTAVCIRGIRGRNITYEVSWWNEKSHCSDWFAASEVEPIEPESRMQIGFIKHQ